jgi:aminoglycoside phosphotransferase
LLAELLASRPPEENLVLCHGDYCLPNVIVQEGGAAVRGFVDWGFGGASDPWRDWAIAAGSVARNLGGRWVGPFAQACGAVPWDARKAAYYRALYELL